MRPATGLREIERRLDALAFDGVEANIRCLLTLQTPSPRAYAEVLALIDAALARESRGAELLALKGKALSNLARYKEARGALAASLSAEPGQALTRAWLGQVHLLETHFAESEAELGRALALDPDLGWASFYRAASRYAAGGREAATEDLRRALAGADPRARQAARVFLGLLESAAGRHEQALALIDEVVKERRDGWPYAVRARLRRAQGDRAGARADIDRALRESPAAWMRLERASLHQEDGDLPAALADVDAALAQSGPEPELFLRRAGLHAAQGRGERAFAGVRRALALDPASEQTRTVACALAKDLENRGRGVFAARILGELARRRPGDGELRFLWGQALEHLGRSAAAARRYREASALLGRLVKRSPSTKSRLLLARLHLGRGRRAAAEAAAARALAAEPSSPEAREFLSSLATTDALRLNAEGRTFMQRGLFAEAERAFRTASARAPENPEVLLAWAEFLTKRGRWAAAEAAGRRACALLPGALAPRLQLAKTLLAAGRVDAVTEVLKKARQDCPPPADADADGWLDRYRLEFALLDFAAAARIGERVLDLTRNGERMKVLRMPFLVDQLQLRGLPAAFQTRALAAAEDCAAGPLPAWGRWFRRVLALSFGSAPALPPKDGALLRADAAGRYPWGYELGRESLAAGDFPAAVADFRAAAAYADSDWTTQCYLGEALACAGRLDEARRALREAESMTGDGRARGAVWAWHGAVLLWAGRYRQALSYLDKAAAEPDPLYAYGWRGGALVKLGRHAEALRSLTRGIALVPRDFETRIWKAEALLRLGRAGPALRELRAAEALNRFEKNAYFHVVRGLVHARRGDARAMRRDHDAAAAVRPAAFEFVRRRARVPADGDAGIRRTLEAFLDLSRGVRRDAAIPIWMR